MVLPLAHMLRSELFARGVFVNWCGSDYNKQKSVIKRTHSDTHLPLGRQLFANQIFLGIHIVLVEVQVFSSQAQQSR